jgi:hypothetical protein
VDHFVGADHRDVGVQSFRAFSERFQTTQKREIARGELVEEMHYNDNLYLGKDLLPYMGHIHISKVDYTDIPQIASWFSEIIPQHRRRGYGIVFAASR